MSALRAFDSLQLPILVLDLTGHFIQANRAAAELGGVNGHGLVGRPLATLGGREPWRTAAEVVALVQRSNSPTSGLVHEGSSGRAWEISGTVSTIPGEAGPVIITVIHEVTGMMDSLEPASSGAMPSSIGPLAASVAHEARNRIFGMSSTLDAAEARLGSRPECGPYLRVIRGELDRLRGLMSELLEQVKTSHMGPPTARIEKVVKRAVTDMAQWANSAGVDLVVRGDGPLPPVGMSQELLCSVLRNLLENAIQHSPSGSVVAVEVGLYRDEAATWGQCAVQDSGPGFRPEALTSAFEPFFSLRRGGLGLGLSIAQRSVEEHGGIILLDNRPEGGASVTVRLPLAEALVEKESEIGQTKSVDRG